MKRSLLAVVLLACAAAGCIQLKMDTTIAPTGSGTLDLTFAFSPGVMEALKELQATPNGKEIQMPDFSALDRERLESACRQADVTLTRYEKAQVGGREQTSVSLAFKKLEDLSRVLGEAGEAQGALRVYKLADGNYTIRPAEAPAGGPGIPSHQAEASAEGAAPKAVEPAAPKAKSPAGKSPAGAAPAGKQPAEEDADLKSPGEMQGDYDASQKSMAALGKLLATAGEMDIVMRITVPGDVISSNAMRSEGRTLIWEITAENMMTVGPNLVPDVVFSGQGLSIDAPLWKEP